MAIENLAAHLGVANRRSEHDAFPCADNLRTEKQQLAKTNLRNGIIYQTINKSITETK